MIDDFAKEYLHNNLRGIREVMVWKLDNLSEYDIRRPLTSTGTNLLGLVKHLTMSEARYFGEIFGRPLPGLELRWDDDDMWAAEHETREEIGSTGDWPGRAGSKPDAAFWVAHCATIEQAARAVQ